MFDCSWATGEPPPAAVHHDIPDAHASAPKERLRGTPGRTQRPRAHLRLCQFLSAHLPHPAKHLCLPGEDPGDTGPSCCPSHTLAILLASSQVLLLAGEKMPGHLWVTHEHQFLLLASHCWNPDGLLGAWAGGQVPVTDTMRSSGAPWHPGPSWAPLLSPPELPQAGMGAAEGAPAVLPLDATPRTCRAGNQRGGSPTALLNSLCCPLAHSSATESHSWQSCQAPPERLSAGRRWAGRLQNLRTR